MRYIIGFITWILTMLGLAGGVMYLNDKYRK